MKHPIELVDPQEVWSAALLSRLPGADPDAALFELRDTINEFFQLSAAWRVGQRVIFSPGQDVYPLDEVEFEPSGADLPFNGAKVLYAHALKFDDWYCWTGLSEAQPCVFDLAGRPWRAWIGAPARLCVHPTPDESFTPKKPDPVLPAGSIGDRAQGLNCPVTPDSPRVEELPGVTVLVSLNLQRPILSVPKFLADYYYEPILDGAVGRMAQHIKRPYSDLNLGTYHLKRFRNGIRVAKDEVLRRWSTAERRNSFPLDWARVG